MIERPSAHPPRRAVMRAALVLPAALLVACAGAPAPSPTAPAAVPTTAIPTAAPAAQPAATQIARATPSAAAPAVTPPATAAATAAVTSTASGVAPPAAATTKLNLNTATAAQFRTIPNVGDRMVREFEEYRPYRSIQQFRREIGKYVSADQVAAYERYVFVPVDPNAADAATLQQLPGVDAALAAHLVAGRPYASADAFLTTLSQSLGADQVTVARAYLTTA